MFLCSLFHLPQKSLINDGMSGAASALAAVPTAPTGAFIKSMAVKKKNLIHQSGNGVKSTFAKIGRHWPKSANGKGPN